MYQSVNKNEEFEKMFYEFIEHFEKSFIKLQESKIKINLNKTYVPNYACLWNKIENIGKPCKIIQCNNKAVMVKFIGDDSTSLLNRLYRIEDLSEIKDR